MARYPMGPHRPTTTVAPMSHGELAEPSGMAATYERDGHVATITYHRPEAANTVNGAMRRDLNAAWERFMADEDAWVAILTGAGDRHFCGGADLRDPEGSTGDFNGTFWEVPTVNSFESGLEVFKPTIAAVNGACVGYGLTAVVSCDFVVASDRAPFSWPEVTIGLPTIVGAIRLPRKVAWADGARPLRGPRGPPRRGRAAPETWVGPRPCGSARQCAGWPAPPTTPPRAGPPGGRSDLPNGKVAEQTARLNPLHSRQSSMPGRVP